MPARKIALLVLIASSPARADDDYVDIVETSDGSVWKGVVTEETPNVSYKLATADGSLHVIKASDVVKVTRQRTARPAAKTVARADKLDDTPEVVAQARAQPADGVRIDPELAFVFPTGDLTNIAMTPISYQMSFSPGGRVGYEMFRGDISYGAGALVRYTSWKLPDLIASAGSHWTLETQLYGRAALQLGRAAPYAGIALGLDTNQTHSNTSNVTSTAISFGMNLQAGLTVAATSSTMLELGLDFHPGTDTVEQGVKMSVSYFALRLGAAFRL